MSKGRSSASDRMAKDGMPKGGGRTRAGGWMPPKEGTKGEKGTGKPQAKRDLMKSDAIGKKLGDGWKAKRTAS